MEIPIRFSNCIWCEAPFASRDSCADSSLAIRSKEHVFPQSIMGRLWSYDVCQQCNSRLGSEVDIALLNDQHILKTANELGLAHILPPMDVAVAMPRERSLIYRVKRGSFKVKPQFTSRQFAIGTASGQAGANDVINAKQFMIRRISEKSLPGLSLPEIMQRVDKLFEELLSSSGETEIFDSVIQVGVRSTAIPSQGTVTITSHPWQTQWAIAKIAFEMAMVAPPEAAVGASLPVLRVIRDFVLARKPHVGIFTRRTLTTVPQMLHMVSIEFSKSAFLITVTVFGREHWTIQFPLKPLPGFRWHRTLAINDCTSDQACSITG
jgi:hypothetical protein